MSILAIKGHPTKGKEVIEILEMLGGKVYIKEIYKGEYPDRYYFINKNDGFIHTYFSETVDILNAFQTFTLEEFLAKFPYKVGDKAFAFGNKCTIIDAVWDEGIDEIVYTIKLDTSKYTTTKLSNQLQPYKEETRESKPNLLQQYMQSNQYPKTYEECCEIMGIEYPVVGGKPDGLSASTYRITEIRPFIYLLVCRDAYLKIAGEQLGLGKPWEPDWVNAIYTCTIICRSNKVVKDGGFDADNRILTFPTEEMRDAFYENFKELIETVKELL